MRNARARENHPTREKATHVSPFLAWGDFHARSRFARSTLHEEKCGTTCSLGQPGQPGLCEEALNPLNPKIKI